MKDRQDSLFCQDCQGELSAVINVTKIERHFRHKNDEIICTASYESALHFAAKDILLRHRSVFIPEHGDVSYDKVDAEKPCEEIRPDITIQTASGEIYIEIVVSNHLSEAKEVYFGKRKALCLVIDLTEIDRDIDRQALENIVLPDSGYKWIIQAIPDIAEPSTANSSTKWVTRALLAGIIYLLFTWIKRQFRRPKKFNRRR